MILYINGEIAQVNTSRNVSLDIKKEIEFRIIKKNICQNYAKLDLVNCQLKSTYDELSTNFHQCHFSSQHSFNEFSNILNEISESVELANYTNSQE